MTRSALSWLLVMSFTFGLAISTPNPHPAARSKFTIGSSDGSADRNEGWMFTIGVVASVAGNVLISFALNLQRYSHIRIDREFQQRLAVKRAQAYSDNEHIQMTSQDYGTCPSDGRSPGTESSTAMSDGEGDARDSSRQSISSATNSSRFAVFEEARRQSYLRSPYWWAGILLMITGEAGNFLAYGFAPASVISPLGVVAIISNCLIAPIMLGETLRHRDLIGVSVAIVGTVVIVVSLPSSERVIGPQDLFTILKTTAFFVYTVVTITMISVLMWMSESCGANSIMIDVGLVGLFGGYTALCTKGLSSLLSLELWHILAFPITYGLLGVLVGTALMQIRYINRALQRFDSTQVIPTQFVSFTIAVIIGSAVVYRDFEAATPREAGIFTGGCALTFFGVYLITSSRSRRSRAAKLDEEAGTTTWAGQTMPAYTDEEEPLIAGPPAANRTEVSPLRSLLDVEDISEEEDSGSLTPRARSPQHSVSEASSLLASETTTDSPARSQSRSHSPIKGHQSSAQNHENSLASPTRTDSREVQLCFPSAPGLGVTEAHNQPPPDSGSMEPECEDPSTGRITKRNTREGYHRSLPSSSFFTPGPFLAPISGGITAVLADTLNKTNPSASENAQDPSVALPLGINRWNSVCLFHENVGDQRNARASHRRSRADTITPSSRHRAFMNNRPRNYADVMNAAEDDLRRPSRIRSFSDSLSGGLSWINAAVWKKQPDPTLPGPDAEA